MNRIAQKTLIGLLVTFIAVNAANAQQFHYHYDYSGQLNLDFGPDPFGLNGEGFNAQLTILNPSPDFVNGSRFDYNGEAGRVDFDSLSLTADDAFAVFRQELPNFDIMDMGLRTSAGDFIFTLRFAVGANDDVPPPAIYDGFPVLGSTLLQPGDENTVFQIVNTSLAVTLIPLTNADQFNVLRGFQIDGGLADVQDSDDTYLKFQPGITLSISEPPVWLEFAGTLPSDSPTMLTVTLEAQADTVGLTQRIEIFNWNSGQYEQVDAGDASFNHDSAAHVNLTAGISDYVQAETGDVKSRLGWRATGPILIFPWTVCIDQVVWGSTE